MDEIRKVNETGSGNDAANFDRDRDIPARAEETLEREEQRGVPRGDHDLEHNPRSTRGNPRDDEQGENPSPS